MTIRFDRLRTLHAFLASLPYEQIDMDVLVKSGTANMKKVKAGNATECGAIGCAMGWAGLMPEFRAQGLKWKSKLGTHTLDGVQMDYGDAAYCFFGLPSTTAARALFGHLSLAEERTGHTSIQVFSERLRAFFIAHGETL